MERTVPLNPQLACHFEYNPNNKFAKERLPEEQMKGIIEKLKQLSIGFLCKLDPSHAELYKSNAEKIFKIMEEEGCFFDLVKDRYVGCTDPSLGIYQDETRSNTAKMSSYFRFLLERELYKEELDKIEIKDPIFVIALPRSGSTFTHYILDADPNGDSIAMYEHISPGSKTMSEAGRKEHANLVVNPLSNDFESTNAAHALQDITKPEEEIFFMEMLNHTLLYSCSIPRLELYRMNEFERDFDWVYNNIIYEMKMHAMEHPLKPNQHLCMKCVSHFASPYPLFNVIGNKTHAKFLWLHRDPIDQLKSEITFLKLIRDGYNHEEGVKDARLYNECIIRMNIVCLKNTIKARDDWIKEDPEHAKQICDVSFKEMIKSPVETTKKIYDFFGLKFEEGYDKKVLEICDEKNPQKGFGRKKTDVVRTNCM